jgi:hypothetical protein
MTYRKRKKTHKVRRLILRTFLFMVGAVILLSLMLAQVDGKERIGAHYPLEHPHAVGDTVTLDHRPDGTTLECMVLYAWEDGSNVAVCRDGTYVSRDPETDSYIAWNGCWKGRGHNGHPKHIAGKGRNIERCYGRSILSLKDY